MTPAGRPGPGRCRRRGHPPQAGQVGSSAGLFLENNYTEVLVLLNYFFLNVSSVFLLLGLKSYSIFCDLFIGFKLATAGKHKFELLLTFSDQYSAFFVLSVYIYYRNIGYTARRVGDP